MFRNCQRLSFLMIVISLILQANPLSAQFFRGHWYYDPVCPSISSLSITRATTFSGRAAVSGSATYCLTALETAVGLTSPAVLGSSTAVSPVTSVGAVAVPNPAGQTHRTEPRNAILKLWVPDGLHVKINGKWTKPQSLAGKHRNSRVFSLTGLKLDEFRACDIVVYEHHGKHLTKYNHVHSVVAGGSYVVYFPRDFEPTTGSSKPPHIGPHPPAHGHHRSFSFDSHDHKAKPHHHHRPLHPKAHGPIRWKSHHGKSFLSRIEQSVRAAKQAEANALKAVNLARQQANRARSIATQVAQAGQEKFELVNDALKLIAYVKFNDDGSVKDLVFEKPTTFREFEFKETTGALDRIDKVAVQIVYRLSIQGTKKQAPITFQPIKETALFNQGTAKVAFYDPANPSKHLSGKIVSLLKAKLAKSYADGVSEVTIEAVRPNGKAVVLAKTIVIQFKMP